MQLDFQLPDRFKLEFSAEDEAKIERPVMIHRAILGSVERMFAILLEHYKGKWPFWLSPRQAIVCPVSEKSQSYALQVHSFDFYALFLGIFAYLETTPVMSANYLSITLIGELKRFSLFELFCIMLKPLNQFGFVLLNYVQSITCISK